MKLKKGCSEEMRKALVISAFFVWAMLVSKLLLVDAEVGEDVVEDGSAGDLAVRTFTERTDDEAKGEQGVLRLVGESKGVRT